MLQKHQDLLKVLLDIIRARYANDVSIMIVYGSSINGTSNEKSDLDMLYIPKTNRGYDFARTFILDGVGYDLWRTDWKCLERFANYEDMRVSVLTGSQLVYHSSYEDKQRYEVLKNVAISIESGLLTKDLLEKAKCHLSKATQYYGELCLKSNLAIAGQILMELCNVVCLVNHTYLHFGTKRIIEELSELDKLPTGFISAYKNVIEQPSAINENCATLLKMAKLFLEELEKELFPLKSNIAGIYEELFSHWNKIRVSCAKGDALNAFMAATSLQSDLDAIQKSLGVEINALRFFDKFDSKNLLGFVTEADKAETAFVDLLHSEEIPITRYENIEQLKQALEQ